MLVGHSIIIKQLRRLADKGRLSHGYLFTGPAMIGKKSVAMSAANYLENGTFEEPHILIDFLSIAPDENGSIGIDATRELKRFLWQKPVRSARRTVVIDDAHLLTAEAQNALLKIAEEPPPSALIMLVTHDPEALNPALSSRFQRIYFSPVEEKEFLVWMEGQLGRANMDTTLKRGQGKPGLVIALRSNDKLKKVLAEAERILSAPASGRGAEIKKLLEKKDFDFMEFLDALILVASWEFFEHAFLAARTRQFYSFWHRLLELRYNVSYFNLNPRLQLANLFYNK